MNLEEHYEENEQSIQKIVLTSVVGIMTILSVTASRPIENTVHGAGICSKCNIYYSTLCGGASHGTTTASCGSSSHGDSCEVTLYWVETYRYCSSCGEVGSSSSHVHGYMHSYDGIVHTEECPFSSAIASVDIDY